MPLQHACARLTDVPHGVVRRVRLVRVEREREEAAVRALAPLQVRVDADEDLRLSVCVGGAHVRPEGRARGHCCAGELDTDRAVSGDGVVAVKLTCERVLLLAQHRRRSTDVVVSFGSISLLGVTERSAEGDTYSRARSLTQFACESPERIKVLLILPL